MKNLSFVKNYFLFFLRHRFWDLCLFWDILFFSNSKKQADLVVSLASFPQRIHLVKYTLLSLMKQSILPKKIILSLSTTDFKSHNIPLHLRMLAYLINKKCQCVFFEIQWCEDIKSYKKLIPTLRKYPNSVIVTADDDAFYHSKWLEQLWECHLLYPQSVCTHWATQIPQDFMFKEIQYEQWQEAKEEMSPSYFILAIGVSGILYPPNVLKSDVLNLEIIKQLNITNDDLFFWCMTVINQKKIVLVSNFFGHPNPSFYWKTTPNLWEDHLYGKNENSAQFTRLCAYYKKELQQVLET